MYFYKKPRMNEVGSLFTNEEQTRKKTTPATGILFLSSSANKIKVRQRGCRFVDYTAPQGPGILFLDFPHSDKTAYLIRFFFYKRSAFYTPKLLLLSLVRSARFGHC